MKGLPDNDRLNWLVSQAQKEEKLTKANEDTKTKTPLNKSNVEGRVIELVWGCLAGINGTWVLGKPVNKQKDRIDVIASISRQKDGTWNWDLQDNEHQGNEPSREEAMKEVEKYVDETVL